VRYGNGEWDAVLGLKRETGSRSQVFSEDLREAMRETVIDHHGKHMAIQSERYLRRCKLYDKLQLWLKTNHISIDWQDADILHRASLAGELAPFVRSLRSALIVGPRHLEHLPFGSDFLPIPTRNCWDHIDAIEAGVRAAGQGRTICLSAGPAAKVLIHRLRHEDMQLVDCGSLWDVYCGQPSRRYHNNMTSEIIERNLNA
jgi:hypothetical protein